MLEHLNRDEVLFLYVRIPFIALIAGLMFSGQIQPPGYRLDLLLVAGSWLLISTVLLIQTLISFRKAAMAVHLFDMAGLAGTIWITEGVGYYLLYLLPLLVVPAGLLISQKYMLFSAGAAASFIVYLIISRFRPEFYFVSFWFIYAGLLSAVTMLLLLRREERKHRIAYVEIEKIMKRGERRINELEQSLKNHKIVDDVTGLNDYRFFRARLDEEIKRAKRYRQTFSLCAVGIDGLESFERHYGAVERDRILARVAHQLKKSVRDTDHIGTSINNQFMIMLIGSNPRQAIIAARRIGERIGKIKFDPDRTYVFHAGFGIAGYPDDAEDLGGMIGMATSALERSRERGDGMVTLASALYRKYP